MKLTNNSGLPDTIERAMTKQNAQYNAGQVDSSITSLIQPPRVSLLRKQHYQHLTQDVSEGFWALLGSGVHHILELGAKPNMIVEERLYMDIDGWKISGGIDLQEVIENEIDVYDYKVTSTYSVTMSSDVKPEWVAQTNMYAMLIEANKPMRVKSLNIVAILRDWSSSNAKRDPMYPQTPIVLIPIPVWSKQKQMEYVRERIAAHRKARFDFDMGEELDFCTDEDRWVRGSKWAVLKNGNKKAVKVFNNPEEALALVESKGDGYDVEYRAGKSLRCDYCGVKDYCSQYQNIISKDENDD